MPTALPPAVKNRGKTHHDGYEQACFNLYPVAVLRRGITDLDKRDGVIPSLCQHALTAITKDKAVCLRAHNLRANDLPAQWNDAELPDINPVLPANAQVLRGEIAKAVLPRKPARQDARCAAPLALAALAKELKFQSKP
jgi:hypothetical protein